ncbi:MAG: AMIN domain-containing protein, partial [Perlucidibaca sp.]
MKRVLLFVVSVFLLSPAWAVKIVGVRTSSDQDSTRLVLELDGASEYRVSEDSTPGRLVITLPQAESAITGAGWPVNAGLIAAVRLDTGSKPSRLLVDLAGAAESRIFPLGPNGSYGHRLVIDLT